MDRCRAWDDECSRIADEARRQAIEHDIEVAEQRKRQIREDAWLDYCALNAAIRTLTDQDKPVLVDDEGHKVVLGPRSIKELGVARDKLLALARESSYGLPEGKPELDLEGLPPELAAQLDACMVAYYLSHQ